MGSRELDIGNKKIYIDLRLNDQGKFVRIVEAGSRGRLTFVIEKSYDLRDALTRFLDKSEAIGPIPEGLEDQETIDSVEFRLNRRLYYCDLRQNANGRFVKITQFSGPTKYFVFVPIENLLEFRDALSSLLDEHGDGEAPIVANDPEPNDDNLPNSREVRAGGKKFYFDVSQNHRGVFLKLSEVQPRGRTHINIPHSSWAKIGEVFITLSQELPYQASVKEEED